MLNQCLNVFKREEVKQMLGPFLEIVLEKCKPYLWTLYCLLFLNIVATSILIYQIHKKNFLR
jgi:hypothetical protein